MTRLLPKNARVVPKEAKKVFSGEIFDIYQWQQKMYDGSFATFEMAKRADTVQILSIIDNKVVVVDEEQPDGTKRINSLPGGRIDSEDDTPLDAAKRELLEETGYSFRNWKLLSIRQPQRKIEWFIYLFIAWDKTSQIPQKLDQGEKITVNKISWADFLACGPKNVIQDNNLIDYNSLDDLKN
jgi:8-oxo-dGTP pyrophosphatase MutT (NUDIX family)